MLEVPDLDHEWLALGVDPDGVLSQGPLDPPHDDPVLFPHLGAAQHRLAKVVIDCGVRAAGCGSGERNRCCHRPRAAHEQFGARAEEGSLPGAEAEAEAGREEIAEGAEQRTRIMGCGGLDRQLAREHDLLDVRGADALDRRGHDPLVALRGVAAEDPSGRTRVRVGGRENGRAQSPDPAGGALHQAVRVRPRLEEDRCGQEGALGSAGDRDLGQDRERGRKRRPERIRPTPMGEREPRGPDRPGARRQLARLLRLPVMDRTGAPLRQVREAVLSPADHGRGCTDSGDSEAAIRLLPAEPAVRRQPRPHGERRRVHVGVDLDRRRDEASGTIEIGAG